MRSQGLTVRIMGERGLCVEINGGLFWIGCEVDINCGERWRELTGGAMGLSKPYP